MASGIIGSIEHIVHHDPANARIFLETLNLADSPSTNQIHDDIEQLLLLPPRSLHTDCLPTHQIHWDHEMSVQSLFRSQPAPPPTVPTLIRSGLDGQPIGFTETNSTKAATGFTSTSLDRIPGPSSNFVRGKSGYMPFRPGGLEDLLVNDLDQKSALMDEGLRTIPPGFLRGLRLPTISVENDETFSLEVDSSYVLEDQGMNENGLITPDEIYDNTLKNSRDIIDNLLPASRANLKSTAVRHRKRLLPMQKREWAHVVDIEAPLNNFHEVVPEMAHKYPFELDAFQKQAIFYLESGNSVFVAAHTSAGKTVVAEYAIALANKHMTRAIYTSPIKALSNQKFRDFKRTFSSPEVGILTGDVQINPEASCLIMTTEILRSMLYKGADLIRDVEFVIFDEVHYVNDAERGVVWEEVIIMLPDHVNIILLSATVSNTKEFADWVGRTKKKDIFVISTPKRPVPLEYYLYSGRDMYKIVNADKKFLPGGYEDARGALRRKQDKEREAAGLPPVQRLGGRGAVAVHRAQRGGAGTRGGGSRATTPLQRGGVSSRTIHTATDKHLYVHLLGHLRKQGLLPVIIFTLSKKRCEENAATLTNQDLSTSGEKSEIHVTIENALSRLKGSDKKLPQIFKMKDLLSRGIGIHHGGLLPLVKELVEILFARGLVKILFATETFAMGVNMPARCVVFSSTRKHDGRNFREILPGEFTQMAGRAGRRGLDPTGTVIIVANDPLPGDGVLRNMIIGMPGKLSSQFRLTYNMILNLLRVEALKVEEMIKRSFSENTSQRRLPEHQENVSKNETQLSALPELDCPVCGTDINAYYDRFSAIKEVSQKMLEFAVESRQGSPILSPGRVVVLRHEHLRRNTIGVLLKRTNDQISDITGVRMKTYGIIFWETINSHDEAVPPTWFINPSLLVGESGKLKPRNVPLSSIVLVTPRTINSITKNSKRVDLRRLESDLKSMVKEWTSFGRVPEVDWNRIRLLEFQDLLRNRATLIDFVEQSICMTCPQFPEHYSLVHTQKVLQAHIDDLKLAISDQNLDLIPDYEQRVEVLQDLRFIDKNCTVLLKGRVACEINSANELILTELILENTLATYEPEEVVALLSCFVFQEKTDVEPSLSPKLETGREAILEIADRVGGIQDRHNVADSRSDLKFGLAEVVYEWSKGMPFEQIINLTDVPEGTIVRVITRLDETCREVRDAARVIGDADLFKKMEECQFKIKRDIVFAASLYF